MELRQRIRRTKWGGAGNHRLDSDVMRAVLCCVQQSAIEQRSTSTQQIAGALRLSTDVVQRYLRALRAGGHIAFEDRLSGTIRVKEWL